MTPLYVGLADFASPTILLVGDRDAFLWLASVFIREQRIRFADNLTRIKQINVDVELLLAEEFGKLDQRGNFFVWSMTPQEANAYAKQLEGLANSLQPAHAYLDASLDIQIIASMGEYEPIDEFSGWLS